MKYYCIGDIHGQAETLKALLDKINYGEDGKIVFLGDYVDRGPDSSGVLEQVKTLVEAQKAIAILGNHDDMFVNCIRNPKDLRLENWRRNYADSAFNSYIKYGNKRFEILDEHATFISRMPMFRVIDGFLFSHSGGDCGMSLSQGNKEIWLWKRPYSDTPIDGLYRIHGHTPQFEPFIGMHRANLDIGAGAFNRMMCGVWETGNTLPIEQHIVDVIDTKL